MHFVLFCSTLADKLRIFLSRDIYDICTFYPYRRSVSGCSCYCCLRFLHVITVELFFHITHAAISLMSVFCWWNLPYWAAWKIFCQYNVLEFTFMLNQVFFFWSVFSVLRSLFVLIRVVLIEFCAMYFSVPLWHGFGPTKA